MAEDAARPPRVGLLFDSVSENTGDVAIGIAARQEFARHGIDDVVVLDPFHPDTASVDAVVVGGGELIRPVGDSFYDKFRVPDGTILNAVGVWQNADQLEYLAGYRHVSARSEAEAAVLRAFVPDVEVLACTTTTLESEPREIPGIDPSQPVVGIHAVPHTLLLCPDIVEIVNAIPHQKVFIPFTHYNYDDSFMRALPFDRSNAVLLPRLDPLELHSVIGQMTYVVTSSLHATLFAYSQGVPFATAHQEKVVNYFGDRGLGRFVFASNDQLRRAIEELEGGAVDLSELVAADRAAVHHAYARYAATIRGLQRSGNAGAPRRQARASRSTAVQVDHLRAEQREHVIANRDVTVHALMYRAVSAESEAARWRAEAEHLAGQLAELSNRPRAGMVLRRRLVAAAPAWLRSSVRRLVRR